MEKRAKEGKRNNLLVLVLVLLVINLLLLSSLIILTGAEDARNNAVSQQLSRGAKIGIEILSNAELQQNTANEQKLS